MVAAYWVFISPEPVLQYGFVKSRPTLAGVVLGLFLHTNLLHLSGNMIFLAAVGPAVEYAAGSWRFLTVYFVGGLAGTLAHWVLVSPGAANIPLVGASGCIAACAAYYTVRFVDLRVPVAPNVAVPLPFMTAVWIALQALGAFVQVGGNQGGPAFWCHLGGFAAGLGLSLTFRAPRLADVQLGHEALERMNQRGPAATLAMAERHLAQHPKDAHALSQKASAQNALGDQDAEIETLLALLEVSNEAGRPDVVDRLAKVNGLGKLPSLRRTLLAERLKADHPEAARQLLLSVVEGSDDDGQKPEALLSLIGMDRDNGEDAKWRMELEEKYPLHPSTELARSRGWLA
jgi:membrane associated rhomboid family serine protease